nr:MAG TPA: hypothetical protein [Caudoviricetes sp.]
MRKSRFLLTNNHILRCRLSTCPVKCPVRS